MCNSILISSSSLFKLASPWRTLSVATVHELKTQIIKFPTPEENHVKSKITSLCRSLSVVSNFINDVLTKSNLITARPTYHLSVSTNEKIHLSTKRNNHYNMVYISGEKRVPVGFGRGLPRRDSWCIFAIHSLRDRSWTSRSEEDISIQTRKILIDSSIFNLGLCTLIKYL